MENYYHEPQGGRAGSENPQKLAKKLVTHDSQKSAKMASYASDPQRSAAKRQNVSRPQGKLQVLRSLCKSQMQMGVASLTHVA